MTIPVVGRDLAKNVVEAHGVDAQGRPRLGSKLRRGEVLPFPPSCPRCWSALKPATPPAKGP